MAAEVGLLLGVSALAAVVVCNWVNLFMGWEPLVRRFPW